MIKVTVKGYMRAEEKSLEEERNQVYKDEDRAAPNTPVAPGFTDGDRLDHWLVLRKAEPITGWTQRIPF